MSVTSDEIKAWQSVVGAKADGNPGPKTYAATVAWLRAKGFLGPKPGTLDPASVRGKVVAAARGELGEQSPDKYWQVVCPQLMGHPHDVSWCGGFTLWVLRQVGLTDWDWLVGKGFVFRLPTIGLPEPGDIAVFRKGSDGKDIWHHAIVERCANGRVYTLDGNTMAFPREGVTARDRPIDTNATFYSIRNLVSAAA